MNLDRCCFPRGATASPPSRLWVVQGFGTVSSCFEQRYCVALREGCFLFAAFAAGLALRAVISCPIPQSVRGSCTSAVFERDIRAGQERTSQ